MSIILSNHAINAATLPLELETRVQRGDTASFVAIVPTRRRANLLRRQWLLASPHAAAQKFSLFTLSDFVALLAESNLPPRRNVNEELQFTLLAQAVHETDLNYFSKHHTELPRGTLETILNTIIKLKENGVTPQYLRDALAHNSGRGSEKIVDIGLLYAAYENKLLGKFRDAPGTLLELNTALANQSLAAMLDTALPGWSTATDRVIIVEGFSEFRKPECDFLAHCARHPNVTAAIIADYTPGNDALFGHLNEYLERLQSDGFAHRQQILQHDMPWKKRVQQFLFSDSHANPERHDRVLYCEARNRAEEVALVTRIVKGLLKEKPDRDLSRICIATRLPGSYTTLFREAFADAGIPANITDRFPLSSSAVAIGFLALLDLRLRDFRTRDIARALASPYFTLSHKHRAIDGENLLSLAAQLRIVGGYRAWTERLESRRSMLQSSGNDIDGNPDEEIKSCARALEDLQLLDQILLRRSERIPATAFKKFVDQLFADCNTGRNVLGGAVRDVEFLERETRALHSLRELIGDVCDVLADQRNDEPIALSEYARQIRAAVTVSRYNVRPRSGKGVLITSFEETRGLDIDVMILAGLVDGEVPLPYAPEIFLMKGKHSSDERFVYQTSRQRHLQDERYLFYQAATNWTERMFLTSPTADDASKELVRSSFLDAFEERVEYGGALPEDAATDIIARSALMKMFGERAMQNIFSGVDDHAALAATIQSRVTLEKNRHADLAPMLDGIIYEGLNDPQRAKLAGMRDRVWSTNQLEQYGKCPFQYFSRRLLRLQERDELEEGLSNLERGNLLHQILFSFFMERRERNAPPLQGLQASDAQRALDELLKVARTIIDAMNIQHPFWKLDIERAFGLSGTAGMLQQFIAFETSRTSDVAPAFFEVQFGMPFGVMGRVDERFGSEAPVDFGGWKLQGKIDRIDAGENDFVIVDYKSGEAPKRKDIENGTSLQLPLYIRALENLLNTHPEIATARTVSGGMYYTFKDGCKIDPGLLQPERANAIIGDGVKHPALKENIYEGFIATAFDNVDRTINGITNGNFPLTEIVLRDKQCKYCSYNSMCRVRDEVGGLAIEEPSESLPE